MSGPLGVASGPSRRSLAQVGSGGSSSPDKGRSLSASPPPSRRVGSSQVEIRLPSRCSHWMTCVPTRQGQVQEVLVLVLVLGGQVLVLGSQVLVLVLILGVRSLLTSLEGGSETLEDESG